MRRTKKQIRRRLWVVLVTLALLVLVGVAGAGGSEVDAGGGAGPQQTQAEQSQQAGQEGQPDQAAPSQQGSADASRPQASAAGDGTQTLDTQAANAPPVGTLTVRFLDVGQGDSELVELPDGKLMLIDAGTQDAGPTVVRAVRDLGRTRIDYLVATHPHADHIGGMAEVLHAFDVGEVWAPAVAANTRTFEAFLDAVEDKGLTIRAGSRGKDIVAPGTAGYDVQVLGPSDSLSSEDLNDYSLVIRVRFGSTSFLFTGDAPKDEIRADAREHVDVLKVAHHGSDTGTDASLAAQLSPRIAVISYGIDNDYGHPTQRVLDALAASGAQVLGTGANGTVTVTSDGTDVTAISAREGPVVAKSE
ncbi:ComEC/Rec2 family competence protein [Atopobiaceae bacterium HCP3S3_F7]